jgi:hypothetical protein
VPVISRKVFGEYAEYFCCPQTHDFVRVLKKLFILKNQQLFWAREASWVELTGSISFLPLLVS